MKGWACACAALDGRLALAAEPDGRRRLPGLREDCHPVEPVELALESHLVQAPEHPDHADGLVGPPPALLERHARGLELARQLDPDADGRKETAAGEPIDG